MLRKTRPIQTGPQLLCLITTLKPSKRYSMKRWVTAISFYNVIPFANITVSREGLSQRWHSSAGRCEQGEPGQAALDWRCAVPSVQPDVCTLPESDLHLLHRCQVSVNECITDTKYIICIRFWSNIVIKAVISCCHVSCSPDLVVSVLTYC